MQNFELIFLVVFVDIILSPVEYRFFLPKYHLFVIFKHYFQEVENSDTRVIL